MKRKMFVILIVLCSALAATTYSGAHEEEQKTFDAQPKEIIETILLPEPQIFGGRPLMEALRDRQSKRTFSNKKFSPQALSNLLWAAFGSNRPGSTMRTAANIQGLKLYLAMENGLFLYEPQGHQLQLLIAEDLREATVLPIHWRGYASAAPLNIVYVASPSNEGFSYTVTGLVAQNVYLYCASEAMVTVVRGSYPQNLKDVLKLPVNQMITVCQTVGYNKFQHSLYFPYVTIEGNEETEVAVINTGDQPLTGVLKAFNEQGMEVINRPNMLGTGMTIDLAPGERRELDVSRDFPGYAPYIKYLIYMTDSEDCTGYARVYSAGRYRAAIPATRDVNTGDMYVSRIASDQNWSTRICLVNTTMSTKESLIEFDSGTSTLITLLPNTYYSTIIADLFGGEKQPDISSAIIRNGDGIVGTALLGSSTQLCGLLIEDNTTTSISFPHVPNTETWSSELTAFNPLGEACTITIFTYDRLGNSLAPTAFIVEPYKSYRGVVGTDIALPVETAWVTLEGTSPFTAFESFFRKDGGDLAAYSGVVSNGKEGVFSKLESLRWTGIALANLENGEATVTLTAYNDAGTVVATQIITVAGHGQVVGAPERLFTQDITSATYVAYNSDKDLAGFQLNGSPNNAMLDALSADVVMPE